MSSLHSRPRSTASVQSRVIRANRGDDETNSTVSSLTRSSLLSRRRRSVDSSHSPREIPDGSDKGHSVGRGWGTLKSNNITLFLLGALALTLQLHGKTSQDLSSRHSEGRRELLSYSASFTHSNSLVQKSEHERVYPDTEGTTVTNFADADADDAAEQEEAPSLREREHDLQFHRILQENFYQEVAIPNDMLDDERAEDGAGENEVASAVKGDVQEETYQSQIANYHTLPRYSLPSALSQISTYRTSFALLIYSPDDTFYVIYSRKHVWSSAVGKLGKAINSLTHILRNEFGKELDGFKERGEELVLPLSSGDYPLIADTDCVRVNEKSDKSCVDVGEGVAPVLHFGSVFRRPFFPNMIAMPPPESHHLACFEHWSIHKAICSPLRAKSPSDPSGELIYAKEYGIKWKDLKDQVVWRGTDFGYLGFIHPTLDRPKQPQSPSKVQTSLDINDDTLSPVSSTLKHPPSSRLTKKEDALEALQQDFNNLVPRWKAVVHTAAAELDLEKQISESARGKNEARRMQSRMLPWANIKFSQYINKEGVKAKTVGSREYRKWEKIGFPAVGEGMGLEELAGYKYHIDLGGGGGTTWSGTFHKLAMPGLLFHHVTPTKDYFHDYMKPWHHYVPVASDLRDLKDKFDWAQSHPKRAFQIARAGSELMRYLTSEKGMEERFQKDILEPLRAVINAYVPVGQIDEYKGKTWREVIEDLEGAGNMLPIMKCTGLSGASCEKIVGKEAFMDRKMLRRFTNGGGFEKEDPQGQRQLLSWAHENFADINKRPDAARETALFWHIPKSGGTTVKNLYHCTGQTLAHRGGVDPKFGHEEKDELVVFKPHEDRETKFVNVDTTIKDGILRAKELGLVQSHVSDIIFTMEPTFAGQNLYDKKNKGRILALFRHPIDRMVSKFYYLQVAHWERGYRPDWADLSLMEWIQKAELKDDNLIVRKLVDKSFKEPIDETDLMHAKAILRRRVVVGLMNEMEESVHRFNIVLGIDETLENNRQCMDSYFGKKEDSGMKNSNKHPKVVENSPEWQLLAEKEWLDMRLYAYAQELFDEQKETIYSYVQQKN